MTGRPPPDPIDWDLEKLRDIAYGSRSIAWDIAVLAIGVVALVLLFSGACT